MTGATLSIVGGFFKPNKKASAVVGKIYCTESLQNLDRVENHLKIIRYSFRWKNITNH